MRFVFTLIVLLLQTTISLASPNFSAEKRARLERGKVVLKTLKPTGNDGVSFVAYGLIDAPVTKVWPVVRDCQYFKEFMPRTKRSQLRERKGKEAICFFEIDMPFPFSDLWSTVRSTESEIEGGGYLRQWKLLTGTYHRNTGSWRVSRWAGETERTLLTYNVDVNPKITLPDFVIRKAQAGTVPDVFDAIRKRVASLP